MVTNDAYVLSSCTDRTPYQVHFCHTHDRSLQTLLPTGLHLGQSLEGKLKSVPTRDPCKRDLYHLKQILSLNASPTPVAPVGPAPKPAGCLSPPRVSRLPFLPKPEEPPVGK